jgi:hypothetical protein
MVATIEYIENVITTYSRAVEANLHTPGRQGSTVHLDSQLAEELLVTGDLHGHRRNFNLIRKIAALDTHPRRHLLLQEVCHGGPTYPGNGGCMSHNMLEDVAKLKVQYPERIHFILSNHELAEISDYPIQKNKQMLNLQFRLGMQQMYGPAAEKVREAYLAFLRSCPLAVRLPGGVLITHSLPENMDKRTFDKSLLSRAIDPVEYYDRDDLFDLVWGRDYREENARAFAGLFGARVLIHGHEPCPDGFLTPNKTQIILDCCSDKGCYAILPVGPELSQADVLARIQRL